LPQPEILHAEPSIVVRPNPLRLPAGCRSQCAKSFDAILVGVLGYDSFAQIEFDFLSGNLYGLLAATHQMHFDATVLAVVKGVVTELVQVEIGCEFVISTLQ